MPRLANCLLVTGTAAVAIRSKESTSALEQTWTGILESSAAAATPVTRAVNLLKEMSVTLEKDMKEDEDLYGKLACWCRDNTIAKKAAIKTNTEKVSELEATIEELTANSGGLNVKIKELEGEVADNKETLAKATALRKSELDAFNKDEQDQTAAIANLKAAIIVLSKHHSAALPQLPGAEISFIQKASKRDEPWGLESKDQRDLDMFMSDNDFTNTVDERRQQSRFLQQTAPVEAKVQSAPVAPVADDWTYHEVATVQTALKAANSFVQKRGKDASSYVPAYNAQSGEIFGILKQLKEDMERDLSDAQKTEAKRAADFSDLRSAKTAEIEGGDKSSEEKEDELAKTDNDLAEAKEDLQQTKETLAEDTKFAKNLKKTCDEADANFAQRKNSRLEEMKAVAEAIEVLSSDEAKDAAQGTFKSFLQVSSTSRKSERRARAAQLLRRQAELSNSPELALIASSAELDAFTKVKVMIDKMVETLTKQQSDEVKKNDFCKDELQSNDMATMKAKDLKDGLEASVEERKVAIKKFEEEVASAKNEISKEQVNLQKATVQRKKENQDFQKTVADQTLTIEVLDKAMQRLATYYDEAALIQTRSSHSSRASQTPPVAQVKYEPSKAAGGVMSLIEKLIYDAKEIMGESKKAESEAQSAYEELVEDSNGTIKSLTKTVLEKTDAKVEAHKDLTQKNQDLHATNKDLDRLSKTDKDLHEECDYVLKNFDVRQQARSEEMESLRQAKLILNGAAA